MTQIIEVSGLDRSRRAAPQSSSEQGILAEMRQRAALVQKRPPIDTAILSDGEMAVELMRQRYQMLADYYPDVPAYQKAADMADNALHNGLHTGPGVGAWTRILDPEQSEVAWAIINGRTQTAPASGWLDWDDKARNPAMGGISIGAIPLLDCNTLYPLTPPPGMPASVVQSWQVDQIKKRDACAIENKWRAALNNYWEKGSLTVVYNFLPPVESGYFDYLDPAVATKLGKKWGNHEETFWAIQKASKISSNNLKEWLENGNLANSIQFGLGPQTGLGIIDGFKANNIIEINGFIASLVNVAVSCVKHTFNQFQLFIGVLKGDMTLNQALKAHIDNIENFFKTHAGDIETLINTKDWRNPASTGGDNDTPPPKCPEGYHWDLATGTCVPNEDDGGGFKLNPMLIGAALIGGALLLGGGDKKK